MKFCIPLALYVLMATATFGSELSVSLGGDAFEGGPAFKVTLGQTVVGTGTVDPATTAGTAQDFVFNVDDAIIDAAGDLTISFTNDFYQQGGGDRNLRVFGARVGTTDLAASDFVVRRGGKTTDRHDGILSTNSSVAKAAAPAGGWSASAPAAITAQTTPAQTTPPAPAKPICDASSSSILFRNAGTGLDDEELKALDAMAKAAGHHDCSVTVTGFASTAGDNAVNTDLSRNRAQAVLDRLHSGGAVFKKETIKGAGETDRFGRSQAENRRVEITLSPS